MATILNNSINWGLDQPMNTQYYDSANLDAFSRLRVSNPVGVFDCQFTYDLQPILFEQLTNGTGATITHDATNRNALMTFSSTPTGGYAYMQSYQFLRYQPSKSQQIFVTFNFNGGVTNVLKFAGYSDGTNGIEFRLNGTTPQVAILSSSSNGNQIIDQSNWNLDTFDGSGNSGNPSGILLDTSTTQIFVCDFEALYVGRVRVGLNIDGVTYYCHQFTHANIATYPYIATANLPIRCGMICTGTVSTTMRFSCSAVASEGGRDRVASYTFTASNAVTAANGVDTYLLSIRPKTTFNSITNRIKFDLSSLSINVTGNPSVLVKLCIGQTLTTPSFADVNATYSGMQVDTAGTLSGSPLIVIDEFYASAQRTATALYSISAPLLRYPLTLDSAGAVRSLGTLTILVQGIGAVSAMNGSITWSEER